MALIERRRLTLAALALPAAALTTAPAQAQDKAALTLSGALLGSTSFDMATLRKMPQTELVEVRKVERSGAAQEARVRYRGVLLKDAVDAAGPREGRRHDFRHSVFVARARDGHVALFTWGELFNSEAGRQVLIVLDVDGAPLPASEGPLALRAWADLKPGPRHVKWLEGIRVEQIDE